MQSAFAAGETRRERAEGLNFLRGADICSGRRPCGGDAGPGRPRGSNVRRKAPRKMGRRRRGVGRAGRTPRNGPPPHHLAAAPLSMHLLATIWGKISLTWRARPELMILPPGAYVMWTSVLLAFFELAFVRPQHPHARCSLQCCRRLPNGQCLYTCEPAVCIRPEH